MLETARTARGALAVLAICITAAACSPTIETRGHVLRESAVERLKPGVQTRDAVVQLLGTPSSVAPFDDKVWYYIGEKTENLAFFEPDLIERSVVVVRFNDAGVIDSVKELSAADAQEVEIVSRETPTAGHELTVMEQLLGNIGRFNRPVGPDRPDRP